MPTVNLYFAPPFPKRQCPSDTSFGTGRPAIRDRIDIGFDIGISILGKGQNNIPVGGRCGKFFKVAFEIHLAFTRNRIESALKADDPDTRLGRYKMKLAAAVANVDGLVSRR